MSFSPIIFSKDSMSSVANDKWLQEEDDDDIKDLLASVVKSVIDTDDEDHFDHPPPLLYMDLPPSINRSLYVAPIPVYNHWLRERYTHMIQTAMYLDFYKRFSFFVY